MGDVDASGKGNVKQFPDNSVEFVRPASGENPFTLRSAYGEFYHTLFDASYDHSPYASFNAPGSSMPSGGSAPVISFEPSSIHPFKIKQWTDPATELVHTDIYYGLLRYTINSFNTVLEDDTNSVESYHASNLTDSVNGPFTGEENQHVHGLSGAGTNYSSGDNSHAHTLTGSTDASASPHKHTVPALVSTKSTVDRFVTIKSQIAATGIVKDVGPTTGPGNTTFGFINNDDGDQTIQRVLTLPAGTFGSIFLKWKVVLPTDQDIATNLTVNGSDVEIHVDPDVDKTAESLSDDDTFALLHLGDNTAGADSGIDDCFNRESSDGAGESEADRTAYFYVKLGVSHNPANGGLKTVDQITYENIYWSPFILGRANSE